MAVLLTTTRITTWMGMRSLSSASGFFYRRRGHLFLVTNRHVFADVPSSHYPDRVEIEVHTDPRDLTRYAVFSIPLYGSGLGLWRQGQDSSGSVDVAAIADLCGIYTDAAEQVSKMVGRPGTYGLYTGVPGNSSAAEFCPAGGRTAQRRQ